MTVHKRYKKLVWLILDGWGIAPPSKDNAIFRAKTPKVDEYIKRYPVTTLRASGESVGLPWDDPGNSEAGHYALGTGTVMQHPLVRISQSIWDGTFFSNDTLKSVCGHVKKNNSALHVIGLVSAGGEHSYIDHMYALLELAKRNSVKRVLLHCILDGSDMHDNRAQLMMRRLKERLTAIGIGKVASIHGREYAMDRDGQFDKTALSVSAIIDGSSKEMFKSSELALSHYYHQNVYDAHIPPTVIVGRSGKPVGRLKHRDGMLFFNFRADRSEQLLSYIHETLQKKAKPFREGIRLATFTRSTVLKDSQCAFSNKKPSHPFARVIADAGLQQVHIAETEKFAHMTYYFNGAHEKAYRGEDDVLIPSLEEATYDRAPEMAAERITERVMREVTMEQNDCIIANIANADMVGHTANLKATITAVEHVDVQVGLMVKASLSAGALVCITSDHGNAEVLIQRTAGKLHKEHTRSPVPFIIIGNDLEGKTLGFTDAPHGDLSLVKSPGTLANVAPTLLSLMGIEPAKEMANSLIEGRIIPQAKQIRMAAR